MIFTSRFVIQHEKAVLGIFTKRQYSVPSKMKCFQIEKYAPTVKDLAYQLIAPCPTKKQLKPDQALVKIHAASINPFDIEMSRGYGRNAINIVRNYSQAKEFPLILGRDFSGVVIRSGRLFKRYKEGDAVYGVRWVVGQGTHAEYVIVNKTEISPKPKNLSHLEATCLPYVACTTWSALVNSGALPTHGSKKNLKIFIPGATGGIGSFAVQLCQAFGHDVITACAADGIPLLEQIGIRNILDYTRDDYISDLKSAGPFDVILDTQNERFVKFYKSLLKQSSTSKYVSLRPTLLPDMDQKGLIMGALNSGANYLKSSLEQVTSGKGLYQWGFFSPDGAVLDQIKPRIEEGMIKPLIDKVFSIDDVLDAYQYVENGHARGKTVIQMCSEEA